MAAIETIKDGGRPIVQGPLAAEQAEVELFEKKHCGKDQAVRMKEADALLKFEE